MKRFLIFLTALLFSASAYAQSPVITQPYPVSSSNNSSTIAVTNTFQSIWVKNTVTRGRAGCTVQNTGSNTMWVFYGPIANATKGRSVVLSVGQSTNCNVGGIVLQDQVSITGTATEAFFAAQQ